MLQWKNLSTESTDKSSFQCLPCLQWTKTHPQKAMREREREMGCPRKARKTLIWLMRETVFSESSVSSVDKNTSTESTALKEKFREAKERYESNDRKGV